MSIQPATKIRRFAAKIDAATPAHRDRTVDALRALAIVGVILGHWLVTALVVSHGHGGTTGADKRPLHTTSYLPPGSWIFQTLAIFCLGGGCAAARSDPGGYWRWLRKRLARLSRAVAVLAGFSAL